MRLLIDHHLPARLTQFFSERGVEAVHVSVLKLERASDRAIWKFAEENAFDIVSKDEDFSYLVSLSDTGPRFMWIRLGNCRTGALLSALETVWPELETWMVGTERIIEIR